MWIVFISYYGDVFNYLKSLRAITLSILGGLGGALAYWSAFQLGAIEVNIEKNIHYLLCVFLLWVLFFPLSFLLFYNDKYWNYFLDKSIIFSFDKSGFIRRKLSFDEDFSKKNLKGKNVLVTGGTSGIGKNIVEKLGSLGAKVFFTGRNKQKNNCFEKSDNHAFFVLDMSKWEELIKFCKNKQKYDYIVLNAGGMPSELILNEFKFEHQCASQLLGHYFLVYFLHNYNRINTNARIVWVSSGGMYLKKLDLDSLFFNENYNKVSTYANVKRAQVTVVEEMAKQEKWRNTKIFCMHPGWVYTEGLKNSLPNFFSFMKKLSLTKVNVC